MSPTPTSSPTRPRLLLAAALAVSLLAGTLAPGAAAAPAPGPPPSEGRASATDPCPTGSLGCLDGIIREMRRRLEPLARQCDHDAPFALLYLRTTEEIRRAVAAGDLFEDGAYIAREAAAFSALYFMAYDAWHGDRATATPAAWRQGLEAADERDVSAGGNMLLGVNAHVNRDLTFVLHQLGLTAPDGSSRKPDHDRVNVVLRRVVGPALDEVARRFDPSVNSTRVPGTRLDEDALWSTVVAMRETAWRNAERLELADALVGQRLTTASVERQAQAEAVTMRAATSYPPGTTSAPRDAYCAAQWAGGPGPDGRPG